MLRVKRRKDVQFRGIHRLRRGMLLNPEILNPDFVTLLRSTPDLVEEVEEEEIPDTIVPTVIPGSSEEPQEAPTAPPQEDEGPAVIVAPAMPGETEGAESEGGSDGEPT